MIAAKFARENKVPYLGICLGMQCMVIEYARHVLNLADAHSTEMEPETKNPAVIFMPEGSKTHMGGTMRLGSRRTIFQTQECISSRLYGKVPHVDERHRHRYEVNPDMVPQLDAAGCKFVGKDDTQTRMEICEVDGHPFMVGCQYHPQYKSRPGKPSPLFMGLILAASGQLPEYISDGPSPFVRARRTPTIAPSSRRRSKCFETNKRPTSRPFSNLTHKEIRNFDDARSARARPSFANIRTFARRRATTSIHRDDVTTERAGVIRAVEIRARDAVRRAVKHARVR